MGWYYNTWYRTNASDGTSTDVANGTNQTFTFTADEAQNLTWYVANGTSTDVYVANFGQDSTFGGDETATTNADANEIGAFHHAPPTGFLALCAKNLPETTISPNANTQTVNHMGTLTYTGNGSSRSITSGATGIGGEISFTPDWVWIKNRNGTGIHGLFDSSRGATKYLSTVSTDNEATASGVTSFDSNGFSLGSAFNQDTLTFVAWNWKAGGAPTATNSAGAGNTPTAGSVKIDGVNLGSALAGTIPATKISANTTSGFSIVTYTGTGTAGTIAHGLGAIPNMYMVKCLDNSASSDHWYVYHAGIASNAEDYEIYLNLTARAYENNNYPWNETKPTNSVFSIKTLQDVNQSSKLYVAYCFAEVEGYSKFGSYLANGSGGEFVYLGFRPAWVMIKEITSGSTQWLIFDSTRAPFNMIDDVVLSTTIQVEGFSSGMELDFVSNGFKIRGSNNDLSYSGKTHIYMAFAEAPFKYANAR